MKKLKGVDEVHEIMEQIYEEEKGLTADERLKKLKEESDAFLSERKLNLRKVKRADRHKLAG